MSEELAKYLTKELFDIGNEPESPTQRIQFMAGKWPDNETSQGGMGKIAMIKFFATRLEAWNTRAQDEDK